MAGPTEAWQDRDGKVTHHQLNCAKLMPHTVDEPAHPCSCGAESRPQSLDDVSGQEWNAASAAYRRKLASPRLGVVPIYEVGDDSLPVVPPVASDDRPGISGEVRTTSATGGQKGVKEARFDLIPSEALTQLAEHYAVGAAKYGDHNWRKGFEWSKSYAALNRHLHAFWGGEDLDPETGKPHLTAVAFHAFTLLTFAKEHPEYDDRFKEEQK